MRAQSSVAILDDDALLYEYIKVATDYAEDEQGRCLLESTWQAVYDCFPERGVFYLPRPPLIEIVSISYLDLSGASQTLSASVYTVDSISEPGRVALKYGQIWPVTLYQVGAVTITFKAGNASAALIKPATKQGIRMLAAHLYDRREPVVDGQIASVPFGVSELLMQDRFLTYR